MWSWDSTIITFDQTCWGYDGSNGCIYTAFETFSFMLYITKESRHEVKIRKQLNFTKFIYKTLSVT